jgi:serine phosphatase RsbU (regulator of sigma subunit)
VADPSGEGAIWELAAALSGAMHTKDVALAVAERGGAAAGADFASFGLIDPATGRLWLTNNQLLPPDVAARWQDLAVDESTPSGAAIVRRTPIFRRGFVLEEDEYFPGVAGDREKVGFRATAAFPLVRGDGEPLGGFGLGWREPQAFAGPQVERLSLIAQVIAQAADRAMLYERQQQHLSAVDEAQVRLLQEAFVPGRLPPVPGLDVAASYIPARGMPMGGDWYDVFPAGDRTVLVLGDVAGHGLQGAATMAQVRNAIRAFASEEPTPARVLTRLNRMLTVLEPEVTASCVVGLWDPVAKALLRANGGHPPVLRCRVGEVGYLTPPGDHVLLGAVPGHEYRTERKVLRPGTTLLWFTDGLIEQRGHSLDDGLARLLSFVQSLDDLAPAAVCRALASWRGERAGQEDDVCLLAVRTLD